MYPEIVSHVLICSFYQDDLGACYELGLVLCVEETDMIQTEPLCSRSSHFSEKNHEQSDLEQKQRWVDLAVHGRDEL